VVAYDRLGFGRSTPRAGSPTRGFISEEAETFFPVISQALGISKSLIFGHSVGGAMALVIAALHPSGCEAVVTEAAQAFVEPRTISGIQAAKQAFGDPEQFAKIARWHGEKARWVLDGWTEVWLSPEFSSWSLEPYLGRVQCPVLAIHGDLDAYGSQEFPRRIVEGVSGPSELEILIRCGHVPHREREHEVLRLTSSFITRYCSQRAAVDPKLGA
jgi:pimeloyl-ACP methyl ester carboxylesterase